MNNGVTYDRQRRIGKNHRERQDMSVTLKLFHGSLSHRMDCEEIISTVDFLIRKDIGETKVILT